MGNFLIRDGDIFSIDGDQVVQKKRPVKKKEAIENLAAYFYNLPTEFLQQLPRFLDKYCSHRNWLSSDDDLEFLKSEIYKRKKNKQSSFLKKIFKSKDPFEVKKSLNYYSVRYLTEWNYKYSDILKDPFQFFPEEKSFFLNGILNYEIESTLIQISFGEINSLMRFFRKDYFSKQWYRSFHYDAQEKNSKIPIALIHIKRNGKWFGFIVMKNKNQS